MEAEDELKRELQHRLHTLLSPLYSRSTFFPGGQPVSFTRTHLHHTLLHSDYYVCEKSDGLRYLLYFAQPPGGIAAFLIDRNWRVQVFPGFGMMTRELDPSKTLQDTLIDGELIEGTNTFLMFDCLMANGQPVWQMELPDRLAKLQNHVIQPYQHMMKNIEGYAKEAPFRLQLKQQYKSYGIGELLEKVIPQQTHPNDGLIFTPVKEPYKAGTWQSLLKWKPAELNTVDFLVQKSGKEEAILLVCRHGIPEEYSRSTDPALLEHDGSVVECRRTADNQWLFVRPRTDKPQPNDVSVADKVLDSIKDNVTGKELIGALEEIRRNWKARERGETVTVVKPLLEWKSFEEYDDYASQTTKKIRSEREQDGEQTSEAPLEYDIQL